MAFTAASEAAGALLSGVQTLSCHSCSLQAHLRVCPWDECVDVSDSASPQGQGLCCVACIPCPTLASLWAETPHFTKGPCFL